MNSYVILLCMKQEAAKEAKTSQENKRTGQPKCDKVRIK